MHCLGTATTEKNVQLSIKTKVLHVMPTKTSVFGQFYNWYKEKRNTYISIQHHIKWLYTCVSISSTDNPVEFQNNLGIFLVKDVMYRHLTVNFRVPWQPISEHTIKMWNKPHLVKVKEKIFFIFTSVVVFVLLSSIRPLRQSVRCEVRFQCGHRLYKTQLQKTIYVCIISVIFQ